MTMKTELRWEYVAADTARLEVPGGWLYRYIWGGSFAHPGEAAMVFVPRPEARIG